jgi:hypothetical protein
MPLNRWYGETSARLDNSAAGLQRVTLGPLERYGEVISGAFIALVGVVFWLWPVL